MSEARPRPAPFEIEGMRDRALWLARLRWFAAFAVAATTGLAAGLELLSTAPQLLAVAAGMVVHNLVVVRWLRRHPHAGLERLHGAVALSLLLDFVALSLLLHFSDSIENPFVMLFAFPAAMGATLLPPRTAFALSGFGGLFHAGVVACELQGVIAHHELTGVRPEHSVDERLQHGPTVFGYLVALALLLMGVTYFVAAVAKQQRKAQQRWRERERIAQSRGRLARVGQLAAGVAHSVRNPLHGLISARDLLASQVRADPASEQTLALMEEALRRIDIITQRLLVLTRDAPLAPRPTDMDELVEETRSMVSSRAGAARVPIEVTAGAVGVAEVDPDQLSEALANIVDNAVQACEAGGEVQVSTHAAKGEDTVVIEVRDTGTGIAPESVPRLFDPFFTTKAVGTGTGLGLSIARRVVEEHGGEIQVESEVDVGTIVMITIPRRAARSEEGDEHV
jgi:signal transduction histidine kinase